MLKKISLFSLFFLCSVSYSQTNSSNAGSRNDSASCDSTCMAQVQQQSYESNLQQRIIPCVSGFTGTRLQTRVKLADGSWSPWADKNIDNCNCSPTFQDRTGVCPAGQKGILTERSNWTCTGPKSGVWSEWSTHTNNCYTPCVAQAPQTRTVACGSYGSLWRGNKTQTRTSSCSSDDKLPPSWSDWTTISSNCYIAYPDPDPTPTDPSGGGNNGGNTGGGCPPGCRTESYSYSYPLGGVMRTCTKTQQVCATSPTICEINVISDICN